jgi:hypothetical protein
LLAAGMSCVLFVVESARVRGRWGREAAAEGGAGAVVWSGLVVVPPWAEGGGLGFGAGGRRVQHECLVSRRYWSTTPTADGRPVHRTSTVPLAEIVLFKSF